VTDVGKIRIALTISGAVSLGAYEAGVLAALLSAIGPLCEGDDPDVRIDAIGGASAGAITGLLAGRTLTAGLDPVAVMKAAWVERDSISSLFKKYQGAPFSMAALQQMATDLIDKDKAKLGAHHQSHDVELVMVLTALRGLSYQIPRPAQQVANPAQTTTIPARPPLHATTFVDLIRTTLSPDTTLDELVQPPDASVVRTALASGANEMGFPPLSVNRKAAADSYRDNGITDFPDDATLWYSDGGTLDNEPLGRTLDLVEEIDRKEPGDFTRLHVLIHPHIHAAPSETAWANPENPPTWAATLTRALSILLAQSTYDDLRSMQKTNTRLTWLEELDGVVGDRLNQLPPTERSSVAQALATVLQSFDQQRSTLPAHRHPALADQVDNSDPRALLRAVVATIAGLVEKRPIAVEVISPMLVGGTAKAGSDKLLAGKTMADFGGFLDERLRLSDFNLGYRCALEWLDGQKSLVAYGLAEGDNKLAVDAAKAAHTPPDEEKDAQWQDWSAGKLLLRHPLTSLRLGWRGVRVGAHALVTHHPQT
jgi:predicted acylesterase/phospholipase RssA